MLLANINFLWHFFKYFAGQYIYSFSARSFYFWNVNLIKYFIHVYLWYKFWNDKQEKENGQNHSNRYTSGVVKYNTPGTKKRLLI